MKKQSSPKSGTFKTGEKAPLKDTYEVTSTGNRKPPTREEKVIPLDKGERFPPIRSQNTSANYKRKNKK